MPDMMDGMSMNLEQTNMDKLRAVFPECFVEGRLDIDKLLSLCGEYSAMTLKNTSLNGRARRNA